LPDKGALERQVEASHKQVSRDFGGQFDHQREQRGGLQGARGPHQVEAFGVPRAPVDPFRPYSPRDRPGAIYIFIDR